MRTEADLREQIRAKVVRLAKALRKNPAGLTDDDILLERGMLDSAAVLELIVWLEAECGTELDPGDLSLDNFGSISLMASYLSARQGAR